MSHGLWKSSTIKCKLSEHYNFEGIHTSMPFQSPLKTHLKALKYFLHVDCVGH